MFINTITTLVILAVALSLSHAYVRIPLATAVAPATRSFLSVLDFPAARSPIARELRQMIEAMTCCEPVSEASIVSPSFYGSTNMKMDVKETEKSYEIAVDLPGVDKKDIKLSIEDNMLTITAERQAMKKEEGDSFKRMERFSGVASRSMSLPENVDVDNIEASNENGVLHVKIPKKPEQAAEAPKFIEIK